MHIAITHGYILQGTGSNLYVQNLCCELCCAGHTISLFCQESSPEQLDFVAEAVDFDEANEKHTRFNRETEYTGKCTFYRPNIGKLLPVYVYDDYAGFVVKEYTELTVEEIETYIERNVHALKSVFTDNPPDLLISNHLIMQPVYGVRATRDIPACKRFTIVHGSALNFSVRNSTLLEKYAHEAIAGSDRIIVDSSHARNELFEFFSNDPEIVNRTSIIPPGVDLDKFIPVNSVNDKPHRIGSLVEKLHQKQTEGKGRTADEKAVYDRAVSTTEIGSPTRELIDELNRNTDQWTPDHDVADNLETINWLDDPVVLYYGKYLWTKGIHLLISAAPIVLQKYPNARFLIVGFGSFRGYLEALVAALEHNRRDLFIDMISHPDLYNDAVDINSTLYFQDLLEKLKDKDFADSYFNTAAGLISSRIIFTGILTHDFLKDLIGRAGEIAGTGCNKDIL